jgi:hypothetical protein
VPLALPPGEGHCPFMVSVPSGHFPRTRIFWGDDPPGPRCGLRPQTILWFLSTGYGFWGTIAQIPRCGLRPQTGAWVLLGFYGF